MIYKVINLYYNVYISVEICSKYNNDIDHWVIFHTKHIFLTHYVSRIYFKVLTSFQTWELLESFTLFYSFFFYLIVYFSTSNISMLALYIYCIFPLSFGNLQSVCNVFIKYFHFILGTFQCVLKKLTNIFNFIEYYHFLWSISKVFQMYLSNVLSNISTTL